MNISSLIQRDLTSCTIHDTLETAALLMREHDVGCLPVIDDQGHVVGMITDRDICMAALNQGVPLRAIPAATTMSTHVFACTEEDELATVERVMAEHRIRRLPVIDDQGHPIGIISLDDIALASREGAVTADEVASTFAAVCGPRAIVS